MGVDGAAALKLLSGGLFRASNRLAALGRNKLVFDLALILLSSTPEYCREPLCGDPDAYIQCIETGCVDKLGGPYWRGR